MIKTKTYKNGLRVILNKTEGLFSVSAGILVGAGSRNEDLKNNGISHFIEHNLFKGTVNRSAFQISDEIDKIGAQINAFTSKEITCYYTKSTKEHLGQCLNVLSDIFFNSTFVKEELEKEKGVIIEEINMSFDNPEDLCFDLSSESYYGKEGYGMPILGTEKNVKSFSKSDILSYMKRYYTADNVVISISGDIDEVKTFSLIEELFVDNFKYEKCDCKNKTEIRGSKNVCKKKKKIEQTHFCLCFPSVSAIDEKVDAVNVLNTVLGGGMSSRLFQKVREELGLCYSIYSYPSLYVDNGVLEIYSGVNVSNSIKAFKEVINVIKEFKKGITKDEFIRGKEQIKSSFIMGQESTSSQMLLYGKYMLNLNKVFEFNQKIDKINGLKIEDVNELILEIFNFDKMSIAKIGPDNVKLFL